MPTHSVKDRRTFYCISMTSCHGLRLDEGKILRWYKTYAGYTESIGAALVIIQIHIHPLPHEYVLNVHTHIPWEDDLINMYIYFFR